LRVTEFKHDTDGVHVKAHLTYDELVKIKEIKFDKAGLDVELVIPEQEFKQIFDEAKKWVMSEVGKKIKSLIGLK